MKNNTANTLEGIFDSSTYYSDRKLFKELGLKPFEKLRAGTEHFVGEVKLERGSTVKIWVHPMPAQFWKFEIFDSESGKTTHASTGSGTLNDFWHTVRLISMNMFVIDQIGS